MKYALAIAALLLPCLLQVVLAEGEEHPVSQHAYFPTPEGASWTYRHVTAPDEGSAPVVTRTVVAVVPVEQPLGIWSEGPDGRVEERQAAGRTLLRATGGALPDLVLEVTPGGLFAYEPMEHVPLFASAWHLPPDLAAAGSWPFRELFFSCGFGGWQRTATARAEEVTVPAGTFQAIRVELPGDRGPRTLWLVEGLGPVKLHQGGATLELEASTLLRR